MQKVILTANLTVALAAPASAATYPVSGRWGQNASSAKGGSEYHGRRVVAFNGNQRTDTAGSMHAFRNHSVTADGPSHYRIVDAFTNGQISDGHVSYTRRHVNADYIWLQMQGGTVMMQRCK
jgi:hypothetical protein